LAPAGTKTWFPGCHSNRGRAISSRKEAREIEATTSVITNPPPVSGRSVGGESGEAQEIWRGDRTLVRAKGSGEVVVGRGVGGGRRE